MASGSPPRSRIDQFFASRKRKPERSKKESGLVPDGSPSAKGSLEGYLVASLDAGKCEGHGRPTSGHEPLERNPRAGQEPVKRNLTLEIGLAPDVSRMPVLPPPVPSSAGTDGGGKCLELKKFATDFLSLYCSELPMAVDVSAGQELKGKKRNGSPSLLDTCKTSGKKLCFLEESESRLEVENTCTSRDCAATTEPGVNNSLGQAASVHSEELLETHEKTCGNGDSSSFVFSGLRRCSNTPNSGSSKGGVVTPSLTRTPNSVRRSSVFSPGEDFWNEAIQVVDGLYAPIDGLPLRANDGHGMRSELGTSHFLRSGKASNKLRKEKSNCTVLRSNENCSTSAKYKLEGIDVQVNDCEKIEIPVEGKNKSPKTFHHSEASPLPVKHFDFSHEESTFSVDNIIVKKLKAVVEHSGPSASGNCLNTLGVLKTMKDHDERKSLNEPFGLSPQVLLDKNSPDTPCLKQNDSQNVGQGPYLAVDEGQGVILNQGSGTKLLYDDKSITVGLSVPGCDKSKAQEGVKHSLDVQKKHEETSISSDFRTLEDHLQLNSWLPSEICRMYMKKGISKLYPWQVDCLRVNGVLEKRNLIYCASTSAGKSLVAEILMLRRVISTGKMALLVLPYVSICAEKTEHLELLLEPLGKHVRSFYGNQGGASLPKDTSVAVCTIEKANSLVNRLLEEGRLSEVGIIVIDELHMVGDQHRGYLLELMLTKLRYAAGEGNSDSSGGDSSGSSSGKADPAQGLQIVGMSATMPNVAAVADWLQAALYQTDFRPVPLEEYIKVGNAILDKKMEVVRTIPKNADIGGKDPDHIVELCNEVVQEGHSVLLFCSSRKGCESTARHVSKFLKKFSVASREVVCEFNDAFSAIEALRKCPAGLDPILEETLPSGVAYHHAGLTVEEREIVETCYRKGLVRVLTATSTLAAGVNLPARRVIFRQPKIGRDFIDGTRYRQMAGRAGRTGIDTKGESILVCKPEELRRITALLNDSCPPLQSCLSEDKNGMTHAILEVVAGGIVQTATDVHHYVRCTLLNSTKPFQDVVTSAQDSLRWLCQKKFLEWNEDTKLYCTTPLGRAAFGSSLSPEESLIVLDDLLRAREAFVLASDLHLVYLVTPINVDVEPDWELYYERFLELSALDQSVGNRVGVIEPFLMRMAHGAPFPGQDRFGGRKNGPHSRAHRWNVECDASVLANEQARRVAKRFYVALMLSKLVQEVPVADVCEAFKVARGMIQALQENAGRFALMVSQFCERLGWYDLEVLVSKFQNRVSFGVRAEIVELTNIPYVKGSRARALYKAGLRTPLAIAEATVPEIANALFEFSSWSGQGNWHDTASVGTPCAYTGNASNQHGACQRYEGSALRRAHLGIAKKIKNGARKMVLDQAEEARVAAFSAFKSLGVQIPQFSRPLLPCTDGDSAVNMGSYGGAALSGVGDIEAPEDIRLSRQHAPNETGMLCDDSYGEIKSKNLTVTTSMTTAAARELNAAGQKDNATNPENAGIVEVSSLASNRPAMPNMHGMEVPSVCDEKIKHDDQGNIEVGNGHNNSSSHASAKGPINASSVPGGFDGFLNQWDAVKEFCFDVHFTKRSEPNNHIPFEICGLAICWEASPVYYINLSKDLVAPGNQIISYDVGVVSKDVDVSDVLAVSKFRWNRIAKIMERNDVRKVTWNLKIQIQVLKIPCVSAQKFGRLDFGDKKLNSIELIDNTFLLLPSIAIRNGFDMCLASWILWPDEDSKSNLNLEKVVKKRLSSEAAAAANRDGRWRNQMRKAAHNGCCRRVAQVRALSSALWKLLVSADLVEALNAIENPLVKVLADMELWGIGVDMEACLNARHVLVRKLKELEREAYSLAGVSFSLYTAADIASILYKHLKLPIPESRSKGKQHPSTDKHSLDLLRGRHPIISVIKEHRTLAKLLNSTVGSIISRAQLCLKSQKYKIQGHWLQTSTATGRLSMEEPNLQCVEHLVVFRTNDSHEKDMNSSDAHHHRVNARDFFIPTQDNWLLLTADYSQIELRVMAHFSKDSALIELLSKPDGDVFTMISARWTGKLESAITSQERDQTKRLVYGILYGMGATTLAEQLECSSEEAADKIRSFKASFPGVSSWLQEAVSSCRHKGFVETLKGRKRFLSKIKLGNTKEKSKAQRQAVNSICQGSAADIIKIAMINIHSVVVGGSEAHDLSGVATGFSMLKGHCRLILQVHDELVLEVHSDFIKEAGILLQMSMETAVSLLVPLRVKLKFGRTWGSLEPFQPET